MSDEVIDFSSLVCSRLCHDLLSPVGSFGNGLELLADEPDAEMQKRCMELLESSAEIAINRLKFFRLAFGSAGGYGETLPVDELNQALRGQVTAGRDITINWIGDDASLPKPAARVLLLLGLVVVEALIRGGQIDIAVERRGGGVEIAMRGTGPRTVMDDATNRAFADPQAEVTPKTVPIVLARRIANAQRGDIMLSRPADGEIVVGAALSPV